jgi:hypothetical protein
VRYVIFFWLLSMVCAAADEPRFHFEDCVQVTSGFYRDCHGFVKGRAIGYEAETYDVSAVCPHGGVIKESFNVKDLKQIPQAKCKGL